MADEEERNKESRKKRDDTGASAVRRENAKAQVQNGVAAAKETVTKAGEFVSPVVDGVMDFVGGVSHPTLWREYDTDISMTSLTERSVCLMGLG